MSGIVDWLDGVVLSAERSFTNFWNSLVLAEQQHHVILALALIIVLSVVLSLVCNCCVWCCGLCRPRQRQPGLIFVPANYGTMVYPPVVGPHKPQAPPSHVVQEQPQPSTSHKQQTQALVHV